MSTVHLFRSTHCVWRHLREGRHLVGGQALLHPRSTTRTSLARPRGRCELTWQSVEVAAGVLVGKAPPPRFRSWTDSVHTLSGFCSRPCLPHSLSPVSLYLGSGTQWGSMIAPEETLLVLFVGTSRLENKMIKGVPLL